MISQLSPLNRQQKNRVNFDYPGYWGATSRSRDLQDAMMMWQLTNSAFSPEEGAYYIKRAKFR